MTNQQILASIKRRCTALRLEIRELCAEADVSPVTLWRWEKNPAQMKMRTVRKLEQSLDDLEVKAKKGKL